MKQDKRKLILTAAEQCFAKYGYKKTTMEDISHIVGLSKAAMYYYFNNKGEIYITIVTDAYRTLVRELREEIEKDLTCDKKIIKYFQKRLEWLYKQSYILTQITQDELIAFNNFGGGIVEEIGMEERKILMKVLQKCINDSFFRKFDVEKVSNYLFILVDGIYNFYQPSTSMEIMTQERNEIIKNDISTALQLFIRGMKPD
ncbi:TetR/AcrR family transcriptional regulator [Candidatus Lokiarchaeum ossiferum]|uniref:TetR/AcrR family transcriptional regulator n=1 Tax=Candidatus Lokiarchaeum ossiferum TaxID=2951803 RepID=UPI00352EF806